MAIRIGSKKIMSVPEQVSDNTKRIEELEAHELPVEHLYEYTIEIMKENSSTSPTWVIFNFISAEDYSEEETSSLEDDYEFALRNIVPSSNGGNIAAGFSDSNNDPVARVTNVSDSYIQLQTITRMSENLKISEVGDLIIRRKQLF